MLIKKHANYFINKFLNDNDRIVRLAVVNRLHPVRELSKNMTVCVSIVPFDTHNHTVIHNQEIDCCKNLKTQSCAVQT